MPILIALGATLLLRRGARTREVPLDAFYVGYRRNVLERGEFVAAVRVPLPRPDVQFRTYKLAKRFDQDISAVCAAFAFRFDGDVIKDARIAFGGMAATPRRAARAEAALLGLRWNEANLQVAMDMLAQDFQPLSDMRASSSYRMQTAQNLLRRFWFETRAEAPLAAQEVNPFACGGCKEKP